MPPLPNPEAARRAGPTRVLLVDDNPINQLVAHEMLLSLGAEVACALDGAQALAALQAQPYDLVLMDVQMPVLDGCAATTELRRREHEQGSVHTPVVALTANAMAGDRERCLASGMDDYLAKPVRREQLAAALIRWTGTALPD